MNISEVNDKLAPFEARSYPSKERLERISRGLEPHPNFSIDETRNLYRQKEELRQDILAQLRSMPEGEIAEAYRQGGRLLRRMVGGYMFKHFHEAYISTMTQAIYDDDEAAYLFVFALATNLGKSASPNLLVALKSKYERTQRNAISFIWDLDVIEAVPALEDLKARANSALAEHIEECLVWLKRDRSDI